MPRKYHTIITTDCMVEIIFNHYLKSKELLDKSPAGSEDRNALLDLISDISGSAKSTILYCNRKQKSGGTAPLSGASISKLETICTGSRGLSRSLTYLKAQEEILDMLESRSRQLTEETRPTPSHTAPPSPESVSPDTPKSSMRYDPSQYPDPMTYVPLESEKPGS